MGQREKQQNESELLAFSEQLRQSIVNQPYGFAGLWRRAAESYPQIKRRQRLRIAFAVVIGIVIGALAVYFLFV